MTLLDAPKFDEARDRRNRIIFSGSAGLVFVLLVGWWLFSGRPVDWPWNWNTHMLGRMAVNHFLDAVEQNDLQKAYGIWLHDQTGSSIRRSCPAPIPFRASSRIGAAPAPTTNTASSRATKSPLRASTEMCSSSPCSSTAARAELSISTYDPKTHTLNFSPPGEELYLGP